MTQQDSREQQPPSHNPGSNKSKNQYVGKTLLWLGVAGVSAALAYTVVRALVARRPKDETSDRIQQLIDEANHLLKTLDDQKH
ncbi:MAG TPA: hypothetical protein VMS32_10985 [Verrucomicrobiae bacterium]|nr:hypothetical protein [Verrucomicrobiae bacterium]